MHLSHRARTVEPFHAMAFAEQAAALERTGHDVVKLTLGEPDFGAPTAVREAMRDIMDGRALAYTRALGLPELRREISRYYRRRHGADVGNVNLIWPQGDGLFWPHPVLGV